MNGVFSEANIRFGQLKIQVRINPQSKDSQRRGQSIWKTIFFSVLKKQPYNINVKARAIALSLALTDRRKLQVSQMQYFSVLSYIIWSNTWAKIQKQAFHKPSQAAVLGGQTLIIQERRSLAVLCSVIHNHSSLIVGLEHKPFCYILQWVINCQLNNSRNCKPHRCRLEAREHEMHFARAHISLLSQSFTKHFKTFLALEKHWKRFHWANRINQGVFNQFQTGAFVEVNLILYFSLTFAEIC